MIRCPRIRPYIALLAIALSAGCATAPEPVGVQEPASVETAPRPLQPASRPVNGAPAPEIPRAGRLPPFVAPPPAPVLNAPAADSPGARGQEARALLQVLLPPSAARERDQWAGDIAAAFVALQLAPSAENLCAAIAVIDQESGFQADPLVPGLSRIAWRQIETRRQRYGIPRLALDAALLKVSPGGRSYRQRIDGLRTERQMSVLYGDIIDEVPGGKLLLSGYNPVRTGGPMQVSVAFAEEHARIRPYPGLANGSVREAVFTRRGGLHFGIAHLLDYPVSYPTPLFRFADFNAGHYSSRNAAFHKAVARLSGQKLVPDGDLLRYDGGEPASAPSETQVALQKLAPRLRLGRDEIRAALLLEKREVFVRSPLYQRVYALADETAGRPLPREVLPNISLKSPKITRKLTTAWFAERVNMRYGACLERMRLPRA